MKCPLLAFAWGNEGGKEPLIYPDCLKEECAWWDSGAQNCAIKGIHIGLGFIVAILIELVAKMPHAEQFTK